MISFTGSLIRDHFSAKRIGAPVVLALSCCMLLGIAGADARQDAGGKIRLQLKFQPGETRRYHTQLTTSVSFAVAPGSRQQSPVLETYHLSGDVKQEVLKVMPDGTANLRTTGSSWKGDTGLPDDGLTAGLMASNSLVAPNGEASRQQLDLSTFSSLIRGLQTAVIGCEIPENLYLPDYPVAPGATWTKAGSVPGLGSGMLKSTFARYGMYQGHRTAVVHTDLSVPFSAPASRKLESAIHWQNNAEIARDTEIDIETGRVVRTTTNAVLLMGVGRPTLKQAADGGYSEDIELDLKGAKNGLVIKSQAGGIGVKYTITGSTRATP